MILLYKSQCKCFLQFHIIVPPVPTVSLWSEWSAWSSCSINCIQHKKRYCNNGNQKNNIDEDTKANKGMKSIEKADGSPIKNIYDLNDGFHKNNIYYEINNFTNYCADYELVMRNCTNDSCLIVSSWYCSPSLCFIRYIL